jgi:hypothetical protein
VAGETFYATSDLVLMYWLFSNAFSSAAIKKGMAWKNRT